jgi:hypothetical protein
MKDIFIEGIQSKALQLEIQLTIKSLTNQFKAKAKGKNSIKLTS